MTLSDPQLHVPATATAASHPCELYAHTRAPIPTRTQFHHSHPVYLQNRVYGEIRDAPDIWLCGLCHDSVHDWISFLLGEARRPVPEPGAKTKAAAQATVDWYHSALGATKTGDEPCPIADGDSPCVLPSGHVGLCLR